MNAVLKPQRDAKALANAFPDVDAGCKPFGTRVLVQIRSPKAKSDGGLILVQETKDTEQWNTQVAKILELGSVAFKNRTTMEPWPEGQWAQRGDFVRVPKYGGDRFEVKYGDDADEKALFVLFNDLDLLGSLTGDPLAVLAFI